MKRFKEDLMGILEAFAVLIIAIWALSIFGLGITLQMIPYLGYWPTIVMLTIDVSLLSIYLYKRYKS